ncbi:MAG: M1 family aminopeptidase [Spirosomataceae bacterium]
MQHYAFALQLFDHTDQIQVEASITFQLKSANSSSIWFDLVGKKSYLDIKGMTVKSVKWREKPLVFSHQNDRVTIQLPDNFPADNQTVTLFYEGTPADGLIISKNKFGDRTFFGDNWPNRARHWLSVVDHPSDKSTCEFTVTAPSSYKVIANGKLAEESDLTEQRKLTRWVENTPIPTKVMVIGVARFAVDYVGDTNCIPVESWVYPQDRDKGFFDYRPAKAILEFFIQQIGPYSYEKLANVESKTIFGGMENASCIFYTENAIKGYKSMDMEALLAHEIAHQYFGNSASEKDWRHIWLSEGFATYFSALYLEHAYGRDSLQKVLQQNKGTVFRYAKMNPNGAIVDTTTTNLMQLLNPNSYEKGGWVLHMLREEVGNEAFWKGIRSYYGHFKNGNALSADFQKEMELASGKNLTTFFNQWLYQPGYPEIEWSWKYETATKTVSISVQQIQKNTFFTIPLEFRFENEVGKELRKTEKLYLNQPQQTFTIKLSEAPSKLIIDPNGNVLARTVLKK